MPTADAHLVRKCCPHVLLTMTAFNISFQASDVLFTRKGLALLFLLTFLIFGSVYVLWK